MLEDETLEIVFAEDLLILFSVFDDLNEDAYASFVVDESIDDGILCFGQLLKLLPGVTMLLHISRM